MHDFTLLGDSTMASSTPPMPNLAILARRVASRKLITFLERFELITGWAIEGGEAYMAPKDAEENADMFEDIGTVHSANTSVVSVRRAV